MPNPSVFLIISFFFFWCSITTAFYILVFIIEIWFNYLIFVFFTVLPVHVYVWVWRLVSVYVCVRVCMYERTDVYPIIQVLLKSQQKCSADQRTAFRSCLSPSTVWVSPRDQTQVIRLDGNCFYLLNHLPGPLLLFFFFFKDKQEL